MLQHMSYSNFNLYNKNMSQFNNKEVLLYNYYLQAI